MKNKTENNLEGKRARPAEPTPKTPSIVTAMADLSRQLGVITLAAALLSSVPARAEQTVDTKAAAIQKGDTVRVKSNSIWFTSSSELAVWQRFQDKFPAKDVATYQSLILDTRVAWQFVADLTAKVISYEPEHHRVEVRMLTKGRYLNTLWWVDDKDCSKAK